MKQISILLFLCITAIIAEPIAVQTFDYDTVTTHIPAGKTGDITVSGSRDEHDLYVDSTFIGREKVCLSLDTGTYTFTERIGDSLLYSKELTFSYGDSYQVRFRRPRRITFELTGGTGVHFARWADGSMGVHPTLHGELGFITKRNWNHAVKGTMSNSFILSYETMEDNGSYAGLTYTLQKLFRISELVEFETGVEIGVAGASRSWFTSDTVDVVCFAADVGYRGDIDTSTAERFEYQGTLGYQKQDNSLTPLGVSGSVNIGRERYFFQVGYTLYLNMARYEEKFYSTHYTPTPRPMNESIYDQIRDYDSRIFYLLDENGDTYSVSDYEFPDPITKLGLAHSLSIAFVVRF